MSPEILFLNELPCSSTAGYFSFLFPGESTSAPKVCFQSLLNFRLWQPSTVNKEQLSRPLKSGKDCVVHTLVNQMERSAWETGPLVKFGWKKGNILGCVGFCESGPPAVCSKHTQHHDSLKPRFPEATIPLSTDKVLSPYKEVQKRSFSGF